MRSIIGRAISSISEARTIWSPTWAATPSTRISSAEALAPSASAITAEAASSRRGLAILPLLRGFFAFTFTPWILNRPKLPT